MVGVCTSQARTYVPARDLHRHKTAAIDGGGGFVMSDIFPVLFAAHMLGDWVIQTDKQAMAKMASWRAMAGHVLTYHLCMAVLVLPFWHDRWALLASSIVAGPCGGCSARRAVPTSRRCSWVC
jgi:hypothetical protein